MIAISLATSSTGSIFSYAPHASIILLAAGQYIAGRWREGYWDGLRAGSRGSWWKATTACISTDCPGGLMSPGCTTSRKC